RTWPRNFRRPSAARIVRRCTRSPPRRMALASWQRSSGTSTAAGRVRCCAISPSRISSATGSPTSPADRQARSAVPGKQIRVRIRGEGVTTPPRLRSLPVLVAVVASTYGCARPHVQTLYDAQQRVERYIASGEYDRDFARVVGEARGYLERR